MSRRIATLLAFVAGAAPGVAAAQDGASGSPPERIDLTVPPPMRSTEAECARQREAAVVSNEIVVCGSQPVPDQRITSRREAQDRYAAATAFRDAPATPEVAGPGIFRGPATIGGLCVKGILNCPKPPALIVDVTRLPQAPPGSDAERIARGLAPLGDDAAKPSRRLSAAERAELGLPAPTSEPGPAPASEPGPEAAASPAESVAPAAPR
jgi:hypothetical protein